jgi:hypothetical protein
MRTRTGLSVTKFLLVCPDNKNAKKLPEVGLLRILAAPSYWPKYTTNPVERNLWFWNLPQLFFNVLPSAAGGDDARSKPQG